MFTLLRRALCAGPPRRAATTRGERRVDQVDREELLVLVGGDREILAAVVQAFVDNRGLQLQALQVAIDRGDARAVHAAAHTLCGGLRSLCIGAAAELAAGIEAAAGLGIVVGHEPALAELRWRLDAAEAELRELVEETTRVLAPRVTTP